jgi:hypothetical protein
VPVLSNFRRLDAGRGHASDFVDQLGGLPRIMILRQFEREME